MLLLVMCCLLLVGLLSFVVRCLMFICWSLCGVCGSFVLFVACCVLCGVWCCLLFVVDC